MPTGLDTRAQATAARLLSTSGKSQTVTLTHVSGGTYNTATSQVTGAGTVTQTTSGIVSEYSSKTRGGLQRQDGSLIQSGDRNLRLSAFTTAGVALSPAPSLDDTVTLASGQTYTITTVSTFAPAGLPIYYDCNIRGVS